MNIKLAGCVILYNPDKDVIRNIESYIKYLDRLYIVDNQNGEIITDELKNKYSNVEIIRHSENMGIAYSLNKVLKICQNKYTYLLTMDQDSYFINNTIKFFKNIFTVYDWEKTLGISPVILDESNNKIAETNPYAVITSGNIVFIENAIKIGGYNEALFIDEVDNEFCYRGYLSGYESIKLKSTIYMRHCIGEPISIKLFGKLYHPMNHNYIRTYYIIRNRLYVYFKYHKIDEYIFYYYYIRSTIRLIIGKMFFEKDKARKLKSIYLGIKDYINKNMGKKNFN